MLHLVYPLAGIGQRKSGRIDTEKIGDSPKRHLRIIAKVFKKQNKNLRIRKMLLKTCYMFIIASTVEKMGILFKKFFGILRVVVSR